MLHRIIDSRPAMPIAILPAPWRDKGVFIPGRAQVYEHPSSHIRVLASEDMLNDGSVWLHISCSRPTSLPSWEDLRRVKDTFIGKEVEAYQVLPKESEYVNLMPFCLHLWVPVGSPNV